MTEFTPEIFDGICEEISSGKSLRAILKDPDLPSRVAFYKWLDRDQALVNQYARSKQDCADYYAEEIIEIADNCTDTKKARLQIDSRKWVSSKLKPKSYGDRVDHTSSDGSMSPKSDEPDLSGLTEEEMNDYERLVAKAEGGQAAKAT